MYSEEIKLFLNFIKSVIDESTTVAIEEQQLPVVYLLAQKQGLTHLLALACKRQGLLGEDNLSIELQKSIRKTILRYEIFAAEEQQIYEQFEQAKICYVPLKGSVIRAYYKEPWIRTSTDIDVLVKKADLERAKEILVNELGYEIIKNNYHDIALRSPSNIVVELHFTITENEPSMDRMLEKVWEHVHVKENHAYRYEMEPEYLFFHMMAHMLYHFKHGGCGVRFLMDMWVLREKLPLNVQVLQGWFAECEMEVFSKCVMRLVSVWFNRVEHDELSLQMQRYILEGALFGTTQSKVLAEKTRTKGEFFYWLKRIFQPRNELVMEYPKLKNNIALYPFYTVKRWFKLFRREFMQKIKKEVAISRQNSQKEVDEVKELFRQLRI